MCNKMRIVHVILELRDRMGVPYFAKGATKKMCLFFGKPITVQNKAVCTK